MVSSGYGYYGPIAGQSYRNQATADNVGTGHADTYVLDTTGSSPAGWMEAEARVFISTGAMCSTSGMIPAPSAGSTWAAHKQNTCGYGLRYSYGKSAAYNGNGYNYYYTFKSPNITMPG